MNTMKQNHKLITFLFVILHFLSFSPGVFAETFQLKNGNEIIGEIIKQGKDFVTILTNLGVEVTYFDDEISLNGDLDLSPEDNYKSVKKTISRESSSGDLFFWKVKGKENTVYLLGSIHIADPSFYPLDYTIEQAYKDSEVVVFEFNPLEEIKDSQKYKDLLEQSIYPEGQSVQDDLSVETFNLLKEYLEFNNLPIEEVLKLKPWLIVQVIENLELLRLGLDPSYGFDFYFLEKAYIEKKKIAQIENPLDTVFAIANFDDQDMLLYSTLNELGTLRDFYFDLAEAWKKGDRVSMEKLLFEDELLNTKSGRELMDILFNKRNKQMVEQITRYLNMSKNHFIVVGAAHYLGEEGIIGLLENEGLTVLQLNSFESTEESLPSVVFDDPYPNSTPYQQIQAVKAQKRFRNEVYSLFLNGKYHDIDLLAQKYRQSKEFNELARPQLNNVYQGIFDNLNSKNETAIFDHLAHLNGWVSQYPDSLTAKIALAMGHVKLAWYYRGTGYAKTVTEDSGKKYYSYMAKANEIFLNAFDQHQYEDPHLFTEWISVRLGLSYPIHQITSLLDESLKADVTYKPSVEALVMPLLPRWGARAGELETFAFNLVHQIEGSLGKEYYAAIAGTALQYVGAEDFQKFRFKYSYIKEGLLYSRQKYPNRKLNIHRAVYFACMNNDRETAAALFPMIQYENEYDYKLIWGTRDTFVKWRAWAQEKGERIGDSPLQEALKRRNLILAEKLIEEGADVNKTDPKGNTSLHTAAHRAPHNIFSKIVDAGANVEAKNKYAQRPIHIAAKYGKLESVKLLLEKGVSITTGGESRNLMPIHYAVISNYLEVVKLFVEHDPSQINAHTLYRSTPLHLAAEFGRLEILEWLLEHDQVKINLRNGNRDTALHMAAREGRMNVISFLIENGADQSAVNNDGYTALDAVRAEKVLGVITYLEKIGADSQVGTDSAALSANAELVKLLDEAFKIYDERRYADAAVLFRQAYAMDPESFRTNLGMMLVYFWVDHDYKKVLIQADKIIAREPDNIYAWYFSGRAAYKLKDKEKYMYYFRGYIERNPADPYNQTLYKMVPELRKR